MVRNASRNSRRRSGAQRRLQPNRIRRMITNAEIGSRIVPSPDPPEYTADPWWAATVVSTIKTDSFFTMSDLKTGVLSILGMDEATIKSSKIALEIRPVTVRVWGLNKQPIELLISDIYGSSTTATNYRWIRTLTDRGSGMNFSRLGWRFGSAARTDMIYDLNVVIAKIAGTLDDNNKALVYFQVLFKTATIAEPSDVQMSDTIHGFEKVAI